MSPPLQIDPQHDGHSGRPHDATHPLVPPRSRGPRRQSGSALGAFAPAVLLHGWLVAIFRQRQVVLGNLMVFWVLISVCLATSDDGRVLTPILSGAAFGVAVLPKDTAIFFIPA